MRLLSSATEEQPGGNVASSRMWGPSTATGWDMLSGAKAVRIINKRMSLFWGTLVGSWFKVVVVSNYPIWGYVSNAPVCQYIFQITEAKDLQSSEAKWRKMRSSHISFFLNMWFNVAQNLELRTIFYGVRSPRIDMQSWSCKDSHLDSTRLLGTVGQERLPKHQRLVGL